MDIGCLFAPTTRASDHIAEAERLGYSYAYVYDSPPLIPRELRAFAEAAGL